MRKWLKYILFFGLMAGSPVLHAQEKHEGQEDPKQKAAEKKKQEQQDELRAAEEKGRKRHLKMQDKETRKRMKKNKKRSKQINENKRDPFYVRWYKKVFKKQRNV